MRRRALLIGSSTLAGIAALPAAGAEAVAARSVSVVPAEALDAKERTRHERYMALALDALDGAPAGPFAALIVDRQSGEIVCQGVGQHDENPILHGEIVAINACARLRPKVDWRELALYTTAEPCPMCMSAIVWLRIPQLVYGTSIEELIRLGVNQIRLDSATVAAAAPFYSGSIVGGVLRARADPIYRAWAERFK